MSAISPPASSLPPASSASSSSDSKRTRRNTGIALSSTQLVVLVVLSLSVGAAIHSLASSTLGLGGGGGGRTDSDSGSPSSYDADWLASIEEKMKETQDSSRDAPLPRGGVMQMAWQTPIYRLNIGGFHINPVKFNSRLMASVMTQFNAFVDANRNKLVSSGASDNGDNQAFYDWQRKGHWNVLKSSSEGRALNKFIITGVYNFFQAIGQSEEFLEELQADIDVWATVHSKGVFHLPHLHPNELVSGVYYVRLPKDAGKIVFEDPRGPLPPFDNRIVIEPREGDLILFPSWLTHMVTPTVSSEERISIAFNLKGDWESTASISVSFPVDLDDPRTAKVSGSEGKSSEPVLEKSGSGL